jgi:hypothetical protein
MLGVEDLRFLPAGEGDREPTPAECGDSASLSLEGVEPRELDGAVLERPPTVIVSYSS